MNFNALLVSLIPQNDNLFQTNNQVKDIKLFEKALNASSERNDNYSIKIYHYSDELGLMAGVISKNLKKELHNRDFTPHEEDDFPPVLWFWDREEQVILIEKKTSVFSTETNAAKAFSVISNNYCLSDAGLRAHIEPKLDDEAFWGAYEQFEHIKQVQFKLTAPNLFGKTKKEIGDFLHSVVDETNASEFSPIFKNDDYNLNLKPSHWVDALIDWVKEGAGSWSITGKRTHKDKVSTLNSQKSAKIVRAPGDITEVELEGYNIEDIEQIISVLRDKYTYKK